MNKNKARLIAVTFPIVLLVSAIVLFGFSLVLNTAALPGPKPDDGYSPLYPVLLLGLYFLPMLLLTRKYAATAGMAKMIKVLSLIIKFIMVWFAVLLIAMLVVIAKA